MLLLALCLACHGKGADQKGKESDKSGQKGADSGKTAETKKDTADMKKDSAGTKKDTGETKNDTGGKKDEEKKGEKGGKKGEKKDSSEAVVGVRTAKAEIQSFTLTVNAIGVIEAHPGSNAALGPPSPTRVARVFVAAGQPVREGDPLVEFERGPFEAAAKHAEAGLAAAQRARDRAARLSDAGVVPRKDLEQAETQLAQAETEMVTARRSLQLATLKSPMRGVVTRITAVIGAPVILPHLM